MQELLKKFAISIVVITLMFVLIGMLKHASAADYSGTPELFIINEAGGVIAVTKEVCKDAKVKAKGFDYRAYATEKDGTLHEGCWTAPDTTEAPNIPGVKIIPIVNMYFEGEVIAIPQNQFKPLAAFKGAV